MSTRHDAFNQQPSTSDGGRARGSPCVRRRKSGARRRRLKPRIAQRRLANKMRARRENGVGDGRVARRQPAATHAAAAGGAGAIRTSEDAPATRRTPRRAKGWHRRYGRKAGEDPRKPQAAEPSTARRVLRTRSWRKSSAPSRRLRRCSRGTSASLTWPMSRRAPACSSGSTRATARGDRHPTGRAGHSRRQCGSTARAALPRCLPTTWRCGCAAGHGTRCSTSALSMGAETSPIDQAYLLLFCTPGNADFNRIRPFALPASQPRERATPGWARRRQPLACAAGRRARVQEAALRLGGAV